MMAGLVHPESIDLWREWSRSRQRLARRRGNVADAVRALRGSRTGGSEWEEPRWMLHSRDGELPERLVIALEDGQPRTRAALLAFLPYLRAGVDVIVPHGTALPELDGDAWRRRAYESARDAVPSDAAAVLTAGQHGPSGSVLHAVARNRGLPAFVVQADTLTPYTAPLPEGATLLAWSAEDADFWRSGREDLSLLAVGSQRQWQLGHHGQDRDETAGSESDEAEGELREGSIGSPIVLGQMARLELPRSLASRAASSFCRDGAARYLPEPAETSKMARAHHRLWARRGVEILPADTDPLHSGAPLVSILATEILEAAARGGEAWVHAPGAPGWVHEYWHRYGMRRHGTPTPAPQMPEEEPAARIAREIEGVL
jgi:hypothetical protein